MTTSANKQIARAAGTVMIAFVFSQLTGLVRRILVAQAFGTSPELDAFLTANRVPEILFNLFAGGALGSAFIPTFTALFTKENKDEAWRLASSVANLVFITLTALSIIAAIFAPQIVRYTLASGLADDPRLFDLTVDLLRIQIASAILFGVGGLIVGILNVHQIFLIPALTPSMYQLGMIFGVIVLAPALGIHGLAWGVMIGAALYLLLQIPKLIQLLPHPFPSPFGRGIDNPHVREVIRLMGPRLFGVAIVQINFVVNINLASRMEFGSLSAVDYGFSLMLMAQAALAQSVATAAMPTLAAQYALNQIDDLRSTIAAALRGTLFLAVPASAGLILLREPIVALLYQRGSFDERSTQFVAWALLWYAAGLVGHSLVEILSRAFYALRDTKTPVFVGVGAMTLNVIFSFVFAFLFQQIGWMPHGGLALANSLATAIESVILIMLIRKRLGGINGSHLALGFAQALIASLGMAMTLWVWLSLSAGWIRWSIGLGGVIAGSAAYAFAVLVLRVPEVRSLITLIQKQIQKIIHLKG
jgi:putative peptidoglycan lipid II flippase